MGTIVINPYVNAQGTRRPPLLVARAWLPKQKKDPAGKFGLYPISMGETVLQAMHQNSQGTGGLTSPIRPGPGIKLDSRPGSATYWLCDTEQAILNLSSSVSSSEKRGHWVSLAYLPGLF